MGTRRCPQCWQHRALAQFKSDKRGAQCAICRARYRGWENLSPAERHARRRSARRELRRTGEIRVTFKLDSGNRKTGRIPVSISSAETCPPSCSFYSNGCFAEFHILRYHWSRVPQRGRTWAAFCDAVGALPPGQLWRHNEAGDLPGAGDRIAHHQLEQLIMANRGRRGFTFTHKPLRSIADRAIVLRANRHGFTINLSADSLEHADELAALGVGPVAVVLPSDAADRGIRTPAGRHVVVCPNETAGLTCAECQLCSHPQRKAVVGFRAHGQMKAHVSQLVQLRRKRAAA